MRIFLTFLALTLLVPLPTQAYLTPEEVLEEGDFVEPPPNARGAKAARAAQEAEYDARAAAEAEAEAESEAEDDDTDVPSGTIDDLHGSAEEEEVIDWEADGAELSTEDVRDERVLERVERNRLDNMAQNGVILHGSAPEPLHGGAPLAPTGMGTVVAMLAGAAAIGFTLRKALRA